MCLQGTPLSVKTSENETKGRAPLRHKEKSIIFFSCLLYSSFSLFLCFCSSRVPLSFAFPNFSVPHFPASNWCLFFDIFSEPGHLSSQRWCWLYLLLTGRISSIIHFLESVLNLGSLLRNKSQLLTLVTWKWDKPINRWSSCRNKLDHVYLNKAMYYEIIFKSNAGFTIIGMGLRIVFIIARCTTGT